MDMSLFAVVRHINERSLPLCLCSLENQMDSIACVSESPSLSGIQKRFALALESDAEWLLALDADIILYDGEVERMLRIAEEAYSNDPSLALINFPVWDLVSGKVLRGCQLYPMRYVPELHAFYQELTFDPDHDRPDRGYFELFQQHAFVTDIKMRDRSVGSHDFEQYYAHLYVKNINRCVRMDEVSRQGFLEKFTGLVERVPDNPDYQVSYRGFLEGFNRQRVVTDKNRYPDVGPLLEELGLVEKGPLSEGEVKKLWKNVYSSHSTLR